MPAKTGANGKRPARPPRRPRRQRQATRRRRRPRSGQGQGAKRHGQGPRPRPPRRRRARGRAKRQHEGDRGPRRKAAEAEAIDGAERVVAGHGGRRRPRPCGRCRARIGGRGASDLTRGADELVVAGRVAALGDVVAAAGINDVEQGAQLLATSEDIAILGAVVGALSEDDLDRGLQVARVSGELGAVATVVSRIGMPVLAAFLADRGDQLLDVSVDAIVRAGGTRAIARALADTGERVELSAPPRLPKGSPGWSCRGDRRAEPGARRGGRRAELRGVRGDGRRRSVRQAAVEVGAAGFAEAGQGMEEIGSAGALADMADDLKN